MMSPTLRDLTLGAHVEVERLERLIVKDLQNQPTSRKERLAQSHRIRLMIDTICSTTQRLIEIYEDKDNSMKEEYDALEGQTDAHIQAMIIERAEEIREYHRRHPAALLVVDANEEHEVEPQVEFSGEEAYGRCLDLHELYNQYINSKFGEPMEYYAYLDVLSQPHKTPQKLKSTRQYREYVQTLVQYLVSFFHRREPLQDLDRIFAKLEDEFEEEWKNANHDSEHVQDQQNVIDLVYFNTVKDLVELGAEKLKEALASLGLKIGGTIQQRVERLLLTKDTPLEKLDKKHFAKGSRCNVANPHQVKEIAFLEAKLKKLSELLSEAIERTKDNIVKKQALTYEEIAAEREDEETLQADDDTESDDDEQQMYNPLKLPMGWDGKPIPYWLYKLHGLGQEFKCEICGNQSYRGRREFERHFKEGRHQHEMRCLGIPNTKNFNEITSIEEAQELWKGIQARQGVKRFRPDIEEEYEDRDGNVYNKKTYTDLQRQGLL